MVSILGHGICAFALFWLFQGEWRESGGSLNNTAVDVIELTMSTEELLAQVPEQMPEQAPDPLSEAADAPEAIASPPPEASVPPDEQTSPREEPREQESGTTAPRQEDTLQNNTPARPTEPPSSQTLPLEPIPAPQPQPEGLPTEDLPTEDLPTEDLPTEDLPTDPSTQRGFVNPLRNLGFGKRFRDRNLFPDDGEIRDNGGRSEPSSPEPSDADPAEAEQPASNPEQTTGEAIAPESAPNSNEEATSEETSNEEATDPAESTDRPQPISPPTGPSTETPSPLPPPSSSNPSLTIPSEAEAPKPELSPETSNPETNNPATSSSPATSNSEASNPGSSSGDSTTNATGSANRPNGQIQQPGVFPVARTAPNPNPTETNSPPGTAEPTRNPQPANPQPTNPQPTNPQPTNPQPTNPQPDSGPSSDATDNDSGPNNSTNRTIDGVDIRFSIDKTRAIYTGDFPDEDGYARPKSGNGFQKFLCPETALVPAEDLNKTVEVILAIDRNGNLDTQAPTPLPNWPGVYSLSSDHKISDRYTNAILCELQAQGFEPARQAGKTVAGTLVVDVSIRGR